MTGINLFAWAIEHPPMVIFPMGLALTLGAMSHVTMRRNEEPPHLFRTMIVTVQRSGATATEVARRLTERLEKSLRDTAWPEALRSYSKPGELLIFIDLLGETPAKEAPEHRRHRRGNGADGLVPANALRRLVSGEETAAGA